MDDVRNSIPPDTLEELERMQDIINKDDLVIQDLQIMYGRPVIADPLDAYAGKYATEKGLKSTKTAIRQNIDMVKNLLDKS